MKTTNELTQVPPVKANGPAMASLVAASAGCAAMGILYTLGIASPAITRLLSWYAPSGALSGMSTGAVIVWILTWWLLHRRWRGRDVAPARAGIAFALLAIGLLLTFPPIARLF